MGDWSSHKCGWRYFNTKNLIAMNINLSDIENFDHRYRTTLINSLSGAKSTVLIGTINNSKQTNLAIFNSIFHLGATPPLIGIVFRPNSVDRHTLENILNIKEYTINFVSESFVNKAHQTSARYPADVSEFSAVGLTEEFDNKIKAPYVRESIVKVGMHFINKMNFDENNTLIIIGKVTQLYLPKNILSADGFINHAEAKSITSIGLDAYCNVKLLTRLNYAKP